MRKSQFSHRVLPLAAIWCMINSASAFSQEYDFSLQGQFTPSCGGGFLQSTAKEGMPFQFAVDLSLDLLMGEPVVRSSATWNAYGFGASCIQPYNQDGLVRLTNLRQYDPEGKSHPYNMDIVGEIVGPSVQGQTFVSFNPGALSATAGVEGYNTSGSPSWDRMFFSMSGGSHDYWNTDLYQYLAADTAKAIFKSGFSVTDVTVADVDFDMTEAKANFGMRANTTDTLKTVANRLASWGSDTFEDYPDAVVQRIETDAALPVPENAAALRKTIDDIKALHSNLARNSGDADVQAAATSLHNDLQPFLKAVDAPEVGETFWQILLNPITNAAEDERATIAADVAAKMLAAEQASKPKHGSEQTETVSSAPLEEIEINLEYVAKKLAKELESVAKGLYETDCGKAGFDVRYSVIDKGTGKNTLTVGQAIPVCGSDKYRERSSYFEFFVADIAAYTISGDVLTIEFDGPKLSEHYYTSESLPDQYDEMRSELVILLNLKKKSSIRGLEINLDDLIAYGPD